MITRDVLLAGARAFIERAQVPLDRKTEAAAQAMADHADSPLMAAIVAAVEADREAPVPLSGPASGEIPAQRVGAHDDR